jgi:transcriptional regulator with XRE-family HTH domain
MNKTIHAESVKHALALKGWAQKDLAKAIGVSAQSVTNWLAGADFPRPDKLLKLALTLQLPFAQLVTAPMDQPVVAFRKRANTKTTDEHISKAMGMGALLKLLIPFLPPISKLRTNISLPSTAYSRLQGDVSQVRSKLGLADAVVLHYETLIDEFKQSGAVLVPTLWGQKNRHENALHILLRTEDVTFVFLNLDTRLEDFKFWMAHELAHVYTPDLAGTEEGENFADAFAGALLFPEACAQATYSEALKAGNVTGEIGVLQAYAQQHAISLLTVFKQVKAYADNHGLATLRVSELAVHKVRNSFVPQMVSEQLFASSPPRPELYVAAANRTFSSSFFDALGRMIREQSVGVSYVQQVMDIALRDATALHGALTR